MTLADFNLIEDFELAPLIGGMVAANTLQLDLSFTNPELTDRSFPTPQSFQDWLDTQLQQAGKTFAIGGYNERRVWYQRHPEAYGLGENARCIHLGVDVWAPAGTVINAPLAGTVHSFHDNARAGNYGPTIILQHTIGGLTVHSLYGHLSRRSLNDLKIGNSIAAGSALATLGDTEENGVWAAHLHFQLMWDMQGWEGDYPGVCTLAEREAYLRNCPDPMQLVHMA